MEKIKLTIHNHLSIDNDRRKNHEVEAEIYLFEKTVDDKNDNLERREPIRKYRVVVPPDGNEPVEIITDYHDAFLKITTRHIPRQGAREGMKVFPGTKLGSMHHFESELRGNKFTTTIHYKKNHDEKRPGGITHDDPEVHHPDVGPFK